MIIYAEKSKNDYQLINLSGLCEIQDIPSTSRTYLLLIN